MPTTSRRRGEALLEAVRAATLAEMAEHGLRGASMDRIASRASTSKATLYRRWPNVRALALDAFIVTLEASQATDYPDTGSIRNDLVDSLTDFSAAIHGSLGIVLRELISEAAHDPTLVEEFQNRFGAPQMAHVMTALQRAMLRGEIPTRPVDPYVLEIPAAFVVHRMLMTGVPPTPAECQHIVDAIVMPLLAPPAP